MDLQLLGFILLATTLVVAGVSWELGRALPKNRKVWAAILFAVWCGLLSTYPWTLGLLFTIKV